MEATDSLLMQRFLDRNDSESLATIMDRYADMVYSTCRRVLGDESQAADVVQETFFQFIKHAHRITGSLGSWLHQVATRRAVDLVRQNASRRRREEAYATSASRGPDTWETVEPLVDAALEEMPHELREVLVRHYLQRQSMTDLAADNGVSQSTVSRRISAGLELLREKLRARDVVVGASALGAMLAASAQAAPAPVLHGLGKVVLAAATEALPETPVTPAPGLGTLVKAAVAAAAIVAVVAGGMALFPQANRPRRAKPAPPAHAIATPVAANANDAGSDTNSGAPAAQSVSAVSSPPALPGPLPAASTPGIGPFGTWLPGATGQVLSGGTATFGSGGGAHTGARFGGGGGVGGFGGGGGFAGGGGGAGVVPGQPPRFATGMGVIQRGVAVPSPQNNQTGFRARGGGGGGSGVIQGGGGVMMGGGGSVFRPPGGSNIASYRYGYRRTFSFDNATTNETIATYSSGVPPTAPPE